MASLGEDSPTPGQRVSPEGATPTAKPYGSTNSDVEAGGDDSDGPPLSFADLGIPTGPQLADTVTGKRRRLEDISKMEIAFMTISAIALLATTIFTIYKLATVDKNQPDFVFALVIIVNAAFCSFYLVHGLFKERPYEIFILVVATVTIVLYLIVNYAVGAKGTVKLIRLIAACGLGPVVVGMGVYIGREYLSSGRLIFRTVGANAALQTSCKNMFLFLDLLKLDLQLGITMVILILVNGVNINTLDVVVLVVGIFVTIGWFVLGHMAVRHESKIMTFVFWGLSPIELAYIIYKAIRAGGRLATAPGLAACSLTAGVLAALTRVAVIIITYIVFRNYGNGLKEKAFQTNE